MMNPFFNRFAAWFIFGMLGSLGPSAFRWLAIVASNVDATYREMFGYSTVILIAFGVFVSAVGDIFIDNQWNRIGGGLLGLAVILCVVAGMLAGEAVDIDVSNEFAGKGHVNAQLWLWLELSATVVLVIVSGAIKARLWSLDHP